MFVFIERGLTSLLSDAWAVRLKPYQNADGAAFVCSPHDPEISGSLATLAGDSIKLFFSRTSEECVGCFPAGAVNTIWLERLVGPPLAFELQLGPLFRQQVQAPGSEYFPVIKVLQQLKFTGAKSRCALICKKITNVDGAVK